MFPFTLKLECWVWNGRFHNISSHNFAGEICGFLSSNAAAMKGDVSLVPLPPWRPSLLALIHIPTLALRLLLSSLSGSIRALALFLVNGKEPHCVYCGPVCVCSVQHLRVHWLWRPTSFCGPEMSGHFLSSLLVTLYFGDVHSLGWETRSSPRSPTFPLSFPPLCPLSWVPRAAPAQSSCLLICSSAVSFCFSARLF